MSIVFIGFQAFCSVPFPSGGQGGMNHRFRYGIPYIRDRTGLSYINTGILNNCNILCPLVKGFIQMAIDMTMAPDEPEPLIQIILIVK